MRGEFISGNDVYATLMCYRTDTPLGKNPPKSWADFWDVDKFPGARAARKHPYDTLEFALMADGVAPEDVYPLDVDRAFKSMDRIKPHIDIWWTGGAQTSQLLKTGEVDLTFTWNGRSQVAIDDGAPVEMVWNGAMWAYEGWCILNGGPNVDFAVYSPSTRLMANVKRSSLRTWRTGRQILVRMRTLIRKGRKYCLPTQNICRIWCQQMMFIGVSTRMQSWSGLIPGCCPSP
jgi:hypothetical protein